MHLKLSKPVGVESGHEATEEDGKSLTFLYKLQDGPCDQSFGINVALITNFPADVVKVTLATHPYDYMIVIVVPLAR